ncbi:poly-beta-1,6-N-acetyl-D-glucosamine biosynthesis protein PgaD [Herminiimonas sp.]|uniref:poly-beta-1,6-N-acetyl-D-glucosamine biosynthesis protein PgaD n=1 Tax=Herminiimonas sp. TaxID=1926289 RepID=UPI002718DF6F|nr:poly-beta-1,6-N-acetyl-D-glucosamine biosynthesis protein PgaD [Herminiimonas sp.]MDO8305729.1 poly-beta-1,6-N-acetyl-D-glucosamine biosynthesis protein PgaD [Herminiimonas sp.]
MKTKKDRPRLKLILNMPGLVSMPSKIGSGLFTVVFWGLFLYLWVPLITLVAWGMGIYHAYSEVQYAQELLNLRHLLFTYSMVVVLLCGSLLLWALKEYLRFRDSTRRHVPIPVATTELADYARLDAEHIVQWQGIRRMVAHHDEHGHLREMAVHAARTEATPRVA